MPKSSRTKGQSSGKPATSGGKSKTPEKWRKLLLRSESKEEGKLGPPKSVAANVTTILAYSSEWSGVIAYDEFLETIVKLKMPPWVGADCPQPKYGGRFERVWSDVDTARAINWFARKEFLFLNKQCFEQGLAVVAEKRAVHPVRDYLRKLKWDRKKRLDGMLASHFGAADTPYTRGVGPRWMIGTVARVMRPACQMDNTLILESPEQGWKKTSGFRALVPDPNWYADTGINIGDKDSYQNLRGIWIYGLDELDSVKRGESTKTKNFLTQTKDRYRPSYGYRSRNFDRQNSFCGTTNEEGYFVDSTGNRRYWPTRLLKPVDVAAVMRDRDQLWAEAFVRFKNGEAWYDDTAELRALCQQEQLDRLADDPWEAAVIEWLEANRKKTARGFTSHEILTDPPIGKPTADVNRADAMRIAGILRKLGFEHGDQERDPLDGKHVRKFRPKIGPKPVPKIDEKRRETRPMSQQPDRTWDRSGDVSKSLKSRPKLHIVTNVTTDPTNRGGSR